MAYQGPIKRGTSRSTFRSFGITAGVDDKSVSSQAKLRSGGGSSYTEPTAKPKPTPTTPKPTDQARTPTTPALKTQQLKQRVIDLRQRAGTFNKGLGIARERGILKNFLKNEGSQVELRTEQPQTLQVQHLQQQDSFIPQNKVKDFVKSSPLGIITEIKDDIVLGTKGTATPYQKEFFEKKDKFSEKIENLKTKVDDFILPKSTQETLLEKDKQAFENTYLNRELNPTEFQQAKQIQSSLTSRETINRELRESSPITFIGGVAQGFVKVPLDTTTTILNPVKTTKALPSSIMALPSQLKTNPVSTSGQILGSALGFEMFGRALTPSPLTPKTKTSKPTISTSVQLSDAVKINDNQYLVSSKVLTKSIDPKTKKVIDTIKTDGRSVVVVANTKQGAIKSAVETTATSLGKYGERVYTSPAKITKKFNLAKSKGEVTIKPKDKGFEGTGTFDIVDLGQVNLKATKQGTTGKVSYLNTKPTYQALSNIKGSILKQKPVQKDIFKGSQTTYLTKSVTDLYKDKVRVRGYKKGDTKIPTYLRTNRRDALFPRSNRDVSFGFGSSFKPESANIKIDSLTTIPTELQQQVAKASVQASLDPIVKSMQIKTPKIVEIKPKPSNVKGAILDVKQVSKPVNLDLTKASVTTQSITKTREKLSQYLGTRTVPRVRKKTKGVLQNNQKTPQASILAVIPKIKVGSKSKLSQRQATALKISQQQKQELGQLLGIPQATINPNIRKTRPKQPVTPNIPRLPSGEEGKVFPVKKSTSKDLFLAEVRRFGRWKALGQFRTLAKAQKKGIATLQSSLGASLRVRKGSNIIPIGKFSKAFRPSKIDSKILVQKRGMRLSSFGERAEIKMFR